MSTSTTTLALRYEVEELVTRSATAIDLRDGDLFRTVFADDAHIDYGPLTGSWDDADAFTEFMKVAHAQAGRSIHRMTNVVLAPGEGIAARTYGDSIILDAADETVGDHGAASYDDTFVRTADGLRISSRRASIVLYERITGNRAIAV
jgi:hypothetical protein